MVLMAAIAILTPETLLAASETAAESGEDAGGIWGWVVAIGSLVGGGGLLGASVQIIRVIYDRVDRARDLDSIMDVIYDHGQAGMAMMDYLAAASRKERKKKLRPALDELRDVISFWRRTISKDSTKDK